MHRSEARDLADCAVCGATITPATDRAYVGSPELCLCFACATERGGSWDEHTETWTRAPAVHDLLAAEPHAGHRP
jgi:hypothetical protein